ncbi:hypothetical protein ACJX0J_041376, partial [Zea mays]
MGQYQRAFYMHTKLQIYKTIKIRLFEDAQKTHCNQTFFQLDSESEDSKVIEPCMVTHVGRYFFMLSLLREIKEIKNSDMGNSFESEDSKTEGRAALRGVPAHAGGDGRRAPHALEHYTLEHYT